MKVQPERVLNETTLHEKKNPDKGRVLFRVLALCFILYLFILSIELLGNGFRLFNLEISYVIYTGTSNPFISLFVGLLATAIFQSSSTVTSIIVALVGVGTITLENAVPIVMGANIGTTATSTFVALNFLGTRKQLRRAIMAATVHDFFNIATALILFPLEILFGTLSSLARLLTQILTPANFDGNTSFSLLSFTVKPSAEWISQFFQEIPGLLISLSILMVAFSITLMSHILKSLLLPEDDQKINQVVFSSRIKALFWGVGVTGAIQSSSVTTSVMVPFVAYNKVPIQKAFPFIIGANIGTTFTALIAAISQSQAAISIAIAHLLFNLIGGALLFPAYSSHFIIWLSRQLGNAVLKSRALILAYLLSLFFVIPGMLIFSGIGKVSVTQYTYEQIFEGSQFPQTRVVWDQSRDSGNERRVRSFMHYNQYSKDTSALGSSDQQVKSSDFYVIMNDFVQPLATFPDSCVSIDLNSQNQQLLCKLDSNLIIKSNLSKRLIPAVTYRITRFQPPYDSMILIIEKKNHTLHERKVYKEGRLHMHETLVKKFPEHEPHK